MDQVLKVFKDFEPALLAMIKKVDPSSIKVWQLLDMEQLPTWTVGKLALLGDAAHPFTPRMLSAVQKFDRRHKANASTDQGQGAGQAIEDAATLSIVLPRGTPPEEVPERLKLYEEIRYKRAHSIQEFSRQAGKDWTDGKAQVDSKSAWLPSPHLCVYIHTRPVTNRSADSMVQ